jgi:methylthioribose-1-phosphate isomerase
VRRWKQLKSVKEQIVAGDFYAWNAFGLEQVRQFDVQSSEKSLQRNLQNIQFRDVQLNAVIGGRADAAEQLKATRPTAVNLTWAIERVRAGLAVKQTLAVQEKVKLALCIAKQIAAEDEENCRMIGQHGLNLIEEIARARDGKPVNVLTHCNAGWLAFVDYGSALAPVYAAHDRGLPVHVWVDETRPRSQGSKLTAWELGQHGVPHTIIADGAGGHLMQRGAVDLVMVGSDRTTRAGDVANKIGTYLKALAARDCGVSVMGVGPVRISSMNSWL